jgi:hypothetical protein
MMEFTVETIIDRPVHAVFAYATDPAKLASWQTSTISAVSETGGPVGLGTRLRTRLIFAAHGRPTGPMRLAQPLLRRSLRRQFAGYCATLKHLLENEQPTA